ncbi:YdcF family protein [Bdellovibrio bacteriovorus]|uniref:YdcF family protein n=1 Tax=Bdellovibrio bacteriovorus TaxID=959 RepID=UPI0021D2BE5E|nr:YdcF family protein [Bdellovibrio bacteriovorus]UXR63722.1 YdcF family protein [Bdellovibrio bacteriovorus]
MRIAKSLLKSRSFWALLLLSGVVLYRFVDEYHKVQGEKIQSWIKTPTADCAVVLTGGAGRVREGFDLLANQNVKKLVISGVYSNARLREIMPVWPFYGSLSENDVVLDRRSETTYGNAQQSLPIVEALKCRDILLVTSRLHMYRSYRTFRATFPENIYIEKHAIIGGRFESSVWESGFEALKSFFYSLWAY